MNEQDLQFLDGILDKAHWLFYGDLDVHFDGFLKKVFSRELREWGFDELPAEFDLPYWLLVSELVALDLVEYGTSPRGAWLTPEGERFKKIVMENKNAIAQANEYIYKKHNG
jgi:hypothetical protein